MGQEGVDSLTRGLDEPVASDEEVVIMEDYGGS